MNGLTNSADLANIIGLAVAPVFLLAGVAGFLNVMSSRLGRIIDRARIVERRVLRLKTDDRLESSKLELGILWRRVKIINWSIGLCTASGLMVCALIVTLFVGNFWGLNVGGMVAGLFVLALLILIAALLLFLKEVQLATQVLHFGGEILEE
jgi:hypothetical protein